MGNNIVKIGMVEIGDSFGGQYYLPYSLGILEAYVKDKLHNLEDYCFEPIIYKRGNLNKQIERLCDNDLIFYSVYLWNFNYSIELSKRLKNINKQILNVFGGPQIPESEGKLFSFFKEYPFIDIASFGEGEIPFLRILENYKNRTWRNVPGIGYQKSENEFYYNPSREELNDINEIPSPYLSGIFDDLVKNNPQEKWQARIETNRGCPFTCAFCYWGKKTERKIKKYDIERIYNEIDWFSRNKIEFIFCCDANFGILKRDLDIAKKVAKNKDNTGYPKAFSVQNTKNSTKNIFELQKILNDTGLQKGVNLALQSLNKKTLALINRNNIPTSTYMELQVMFSKNNIATFTDIIIGLPGETYESFTNGVSIIISSGQHNRIQFINLTILENTLLDSPEFQREHGLTIVNTEMIPHHSASDRTDKIQETQRLVTATKTMNSRDWKRVRLFSWITSLFHFNKLLQIPLIIIHEIYKVKFRTLIEAFMNDIENFEVLKHIVEVFENKAIEIQEGKSEYCKSYKWLNTMWYPDELVFIELCAKDKLTAFYKEAEERLLTFLNDCLGMKIDNKIITQSVVLNRALIKKPFYSQDLTIDCDYNLWEIYLAAVRCQHVKIEKGKFSYIVERSIQSWDNWEDWCLNVVWYGNKKGDYIYTVRNK